MVYKIRKICKRKQKKGSKEENEVAGFFVFSQ